MTLWMFPVLCNYIANKSRINTELIVCDIQQHLELLSEHLQSISKKDTIILIAF